MKKENNSTSNEGKDVDLEQLYKDFLVEAEMAGLKGNAAKTYAKSKIQDFEQ